MPSKRQKAMQKAKAKQAEEAARLTAQAASKPIGKATVRTQPNGSTRLPMRNRFAPLGEDEVSTIRDDQTNDQEGEQTAGSTSKRARNRSSSSDDQRPTRKRTKEGEELSAPSDDVDQTEPDHLSGADHQEHPVLTHENHNSSLVETKPNRMLLMHSEQQEKIADLLESAIELLGKGTKAERQAAAQNLETIRSIVNHLPEQVKTNTDKLVRSIASDVKELKKALKNQAPRPERGGPERVQAPERTCVIDKEAGFSWSQVRQKLAAEARLSEDNIRVTNMFTTNNDKIVIKLKDQTDQEKLLRNCTQAQIPIRPMKSRTSRFLIRGLRASDGEKNQSNQTTEADRAAIEEALNRHDRAQELRKSFKIIKAFSTGNGKTAVIFSLDEEGSRALRESPDFFIGFDRLRASPYVHLSQCFKCMDLGHISKDCPHAHEQSGRFQRCGNCGELGHEWSECNAPRCCSLCRGDDHHSSAAHTHSARSGVCQIKRKFIQEKQKEVWP